jgi:hypothetical protein
MTEASWFPLLRRLILSFMAAPRQIGTLRMRCLVFEDKNFVVVADRRKCHRLLNPDLLLRKEGVDAEANKRLKYDLTRQCLRNHEGLYRRAWHKTVNAHRWRPLGEFIRLVDRGICRLQTKAPRAQSLRRPHFQADQENLKILGGRAARLAPSSRLYRARYGPRTGKCTPACWNRSPHRRRGRRDSVVAERERMVVLDGEKDRFVRPLLRPRIRSRASKCAILDLKGLREGPMRSPRSAHRRYK